MPDDLQKLIRDIFQTHTETELDCAQCECQFHSLAELVHSGAALHEILPAVQQHLDCCADCQEEFGALLAVIHVEPGSLSRAAS